MTGLPFVAQCTRNTGAESVVEKGGYRDPGHQNICTGKSGQILRSGKCVHIIMCEACMFMINAIITMVNTITIIRMMRMMSVAAEERPKSPRSAPKCWSPEPTTSGHSSSSSSTSPRSSSSSTILCLSSSNSSALYAHLF